MQVEVIISSSNDEKSELGLLDNSKNESDQILVSIVHKNSLESILVNLSDLKKAVLSIEKSRKL